MGIVSAVFSARMGPALNAPILSESRASPRALNKPRVAFSVRWLTVSGGALDIWLPGWTCRANWPCCEGFCIDGWGWGFGRTHCAAVKLWSFPREGWRVACIGLWDHGPSFAQTRARFCLSHAAAVTWLSISLLPLALCSSPPPCCIVRCTRTPRFFIPAPFAPGARRIRALTMRRRRFPALFRPLHSCVALIRRPRHASFAEYL